MLVKFIVSLATQHAVSGNTWTSNKTTNLQTMDTSWNTQPQSHTPIVGNTWNYASALPWQNWTTRPEMDKIESQEYQLSQSRVL